MVAAVMSKEVPGVRCEAVGDVATALRGGG